MQKVMLNLSDDCTNGDILMMLFPNGDLVDKGYVYWFSLGGFYLEFSKKWWNSIYHNGAR